MSDDCHARSEIMQPLYRTNDDKRTIGSEIMQPLYRTNDDKRTIGSEITDATFI